MRHLLLTSCLLFTAACSAAVPQSVLYGTISPHTNIDLWMESMSRWGVQRYYLYSTNYRGYQYQIHSPVQLGYDQSNFDSIAFLSELHPGYAPFINREQVAQQERLIRQVDAACARHGLEFGYMIPFPLFPVQKLDIVRKVQPEFIGPDGRLDIAAPGIPGLLKTQVRLLKKNLPHLGSICLWLAEGCGEIYKFQDDDLVHNDRWMRPILQALDEVCAEVGLEGVVFAHDYFHTVRTRSQSFAVIAEFPRIVLMEDITWPEENTLMPFLGHFTAEDRRVLQATPLFVNALTDTEYLGQGNWPAVFTRWWQQNAAAAHAARVRLIAGRTFFWDNARTDQNFNRLNAHLLTTFARHPAADPRAALADAAREAFGAGIPERLIDLLWETEPIIQDIVAINGMSPLNHSVFPRAYYLDRDYFTWPLAMKAVDDLFAAPGTRLAPPLSDDLTAGRYWRYERQTVAQPYADYLAAKDRAIAFLERAVPEVETLAPALTPVHRRMFVDGYRELLLLARGMRCFVEAAQVHHDWHRAKVIDRAECLRRMQPIAQKLCALANEDPGYALGHTAAMRQFAAEISTLTITKGRW